MSDQFLSLLRKSCTFDKRRFAHDIQRFQHSSSAAQQQQYGHSRASLPPSSSRVRGRRKRKLEDIITETEEQQQAEQQQQQPVAQPETAAEATDDEDADESDHEDDDAAFPRSASPPSRPAAASSSISLFSRSLQPSSVLPDDAAGAAESSDGSISRVRALQQFRKLHSIHVSGSDVPPPIPSFLSLVESHQLPSRILGNLTAAPPVGLGFDEPTAIQMQAIPVMLAGRECVGCSPTGSGKTAAFLIPIVLSLPCCSSSASAAVSPPSIRNLVIAPTKELASQLHRVATKLTAGMRCHLLLLSKANSNATTFSSAHDIVIATPLRLLHLLQHVPTVDVSALHHIVMDEADRLLDLGFMPQLDHILALLRQKQGGESRGFLLHLFSATLPHSLDAVLPSLLLSPVKVVIAHRNTAQPAVRQRLLYVGDERGKLLAWRSMRRDGLPVPMLVFVQSGSRALQLHSLLLAEGLTGCSAIDGDMTDRQREQSLQSFRSGDSSLLVTTELLARGIDLPAVASVLNWDFPQSTVSYIHRIGRTGRAGRLGLAVTFFTAADRRLLRNVAEVVRWSGGEVQGWMLDMDKIGKKRGRQLQMEAPPRESILPRTDEQERSRKRRPGRISRKQKGDGHKEGRGDNRAGQQTTARSGDQAATESSRTKKMRKSDAADAQAGRALSTPAAVKASSSSSRKKRN